MWSSPPCSAGPSCCASSCPWRLPADRPGLTYLPGGDADYERAVRSHTTMAVTADQLHQTGLDEIERLEQRAVELGARLGLEGLEAVNDALRASAGTVPAEEAVQAARRAVRRAEDRAAEVFPQPLPARAPWSRCRRWSPSVVRRLTTRRLASTAPGRAPIGSRPWCRRQERAGTSRRRLSRGRARSSSPAVRIQLLSELPAMQRQRSITVFSEGWGLYAEQLAEEMGLYTGTESLLGSTAAALMRAARLVVDTGLHARGWSRQEALKFLVAHVPMPPRFLAAEIDRYIIWPGQALAYLTGKLEISRP